MSASHASYRILFLGTCLLFLACQNQSPTGHRSVPTAGTQQGTDINPVEDDGNTIADNDENPTPNSMDSTDKKPGTDPEVKPATCANEVLGIVGGTAVKTKTLLARSTAQIYFPDTDCTATLVGPTQLTTAAHCFEPGVTTAEMRFGIDSTKPDLVIPVAKWIVHPSYDNQFRYDAAVVTLQKPVPAELVPVPIAKPEELFAGRDVIYAGYGTLSETGQVAGTLNWVSVKVESVAANNPSFDTVINGKGTCYGDSGGPGYIVDEATQCLKAVGATSTASQKSPTGLCGEGDTTTDLTRLQGWIAASFAALGAPLEGLNTKDGSEAAAAQNVIVTATN
ncbi:S1 family peptidase [Oligoflexus tunisiensis]|uniref:S1 family peptidase n=1 Tax=Oligoflexus tunisiensis TaxID=708132 RepID=UPI00114D0E05|nr:trypsin-like serine protease [Oligoflexus tunisiensis]